VYNLTKAAVDMLTKSMAVELGPKNIRVNSVNPIIIITPISKPFFEKGVGLTVKDRVVARTPLGRIAELDEVVNTMIFLLSDAAPMINGEQIFIDGGYSAA
jgi:NAD(P)-dependent dehydrogenase (short-subunit alcohol dehydrogenase family)